MKVVAAAVVVFCTSNSNVIVFVLLKWLKSEFVIAYDERHKKRIARSSFDIDGRCPARSVNDMCVTSVCVLLSALVQKD